MENERKKIVKAIISENFEETLKEEGFTISASESKGKNKKVKNNL